MPRLLKDEQPHHLAAFERYNAMGEARSYERLARELNTAVSTVKLWGRSFGWQGRIRNRSVAEARQIADQAATTTSQARSKRRKILELAVMKLAKAIAEDRVKYQPGDLERLLKLEEFLSRLEGQYAPDVNADPEEIAEYLNRFPADTLYQVWTVFQRLWRESYPDEPYPDTLEDGDPSPENCTPKVALEAAMGVRGLLPPDEG